MKNINVPKINLLPYRAAKRKRIAVRFGVFAGLSFSIAAAIIASIMFFFSILETEQMNRNLKIENENIALDRQIADIKKLKDEISATISRKNIVENLQANRARSVMLFNFLLTQPDGIHFSMVSNKGGVLTLNGVAQSNAIVATFLKRMEAIEILDSPRLVETQSTALGVKGVSFIITAKVKDLAGNDKDKKKKG